MNTYESPSTREGDEDRYAPEPALCEVCGNQPGETARDGDWLCSRCDAELDAAEYDAVAGGREQR